MSSSNPVPSPKYILHRTLARRIEDRDRPEPPARWAVEPDLGTGHFVSGSDEREGSHPRARRW